MCEKRSVDHCTGGYSQRTQDAQKQLQLGLLKVSRCDKAKVIHPIARFEQAFKVFVDQIGRVTRVAKCVAQWRGSKLTEHVRSHVQGSAFELREGRISEEEVICLR